MGITGYYWVLLGITGFYWVLQGFTGFYWVLLGITEFYWALQGFTGFYWVLLNFTGFYWVLQGFTGFYWGLLGITGFHGVLPGFTGFTGFYWDRVLNGVFFVCYLVAPVLSQIIGRVEADPDFLPRSGDFGLNQAAFREKFCGHCPEAFYRIAFLCCELNPDKRSFGISNNQSKSRTRLDPVPFTQHSQDRY